MMNTTTVHTNEHRVRSRDTQQQQHYHQQPGYPRDHHQTPYVIDDRMVPPVFTANERLIVDSNDRLYVPRGGAPSQHARNAIHRTTNDGAARRSSTSPQHHHQHYGRLLTNFVTINSRDRLLYPQLVCSAIDRLPPNSLYFTAGSRCVHVRYPGHGLRPDDTITLTHVYTDDVHLSCPFETRKGSKFIRIDLSKNTTSGDTDHQDAHYDNLYVQITGVTDNLGTSGISANHINGVHRVHSTCTYSNHVSNITHGTDAVSLVADPRYIYIAVPKQSLSFYSDRYPHQHQYHHPQSTGVTNANVTIKFLSIAGVPLYLLNNHHQRSLSALDTHHIVTGVVDVDTITITVHQAATATIAGGGDVMCIAKVHDHVRGHPSPSQYTINLPREYLNVVMVEVRSIEIPMSGFLVRSDERYGKNDSIYWQNVDDDNGPDSAPYACSIQPGNYTPRTLAHALQTAMNTVIRSTTDQPHTFTVDIDAGTGTTCIQQQHTTVLDQAPPTLLEQITEQCYNMYIVCPVLTSLTTGDRFHLRQTTAGTFTLSETVMTGDHTVHSSTVFDDFDTIITNPFTPATVQSTVIERQANLVEALSQHYTIDTVEQCTATGITYQRVTRHPHLIQVRIDLPPVDCDHRTQRTITTTTTTPAATVISYPDVQQPVHVTTHVPFRLLFQESDTLGRILGFRNPGMTDSVTPYQSTIRNSDLYDYETVLGLTATQVPSTTIDFIGHTYMYLCCPQLSTIDTATAPSLSAAVHHDHDADAHTTMLSRTITGVFAKIQMRCAHRDHSQSPMVLYTDSVVANVPTVFQTPLTALASLDVSFITPDGHLYDFNGHDHSITLAITQSDAHLSTTQFNPNSGVFQMDTTTRRSYM